MDHLLCADFELRGRTYEVWSYHGDQRLVDPLTRFEVDTDRFDPPLTNEELLSIYEYGRGW